jgi:hypothetical protein
VKEMLSQDLTSIASLKKERCSADTSATLLYPRLSESSLLGEIGLLFLKRLPHRYEINQSLDSISLKSQPKNDGKGMLLQTKN